MLRISSRHSALSDRRGCERKPGDPRAASRSPPQAPPFHSTRGCPRGMLFRLSARTYAPSGLPAVSCGDGLERRYSWSACSRLSAWRANQRRAPSRTATLRRRRRRALLWDWTSWCLRRRSERQCRTRAHKSADSPSTLYSSARCGAAGIRRCAHDGTVGCGGQSSSE